MKDRIRSAKSLSDESEVLAARKSAVPSNVKFEDDTTDAGGDTVSPTAMAMFERLTQ